MKLKIFKQLKINKIEDKKILKTRNIALIILLELSLISSIILCFYHKTNNLFYYNIGITLLKLSIIYIIMILITAIAFDKILKDIN